MLAIVEVKIKNKKQFIRIQCKNQQEGRFKIENLKNTYPTYVFTIMSWFDV